MINNERAILAIVIQDPTYMETVLANCDDSFFKWPENQEIFKLIKIRHKSGELIDWETIMDLVSTATVSASWFISMQETIRGTYPMGLEDLLLEKIKAVKEDKARKAILSEIDGILKGHDPDFKRVLALAEQAQVMRIVEEESDFQTAFDEYVAWKGQGLTGISTGYTSLDALTDRYNYGELISIMGRTTVGKTFLGLNILHHLINQAADKMGFFSMEMSKSALIERMMQVFFDRSRYDVNRDRISNRINENEFLEKYKNLELYSNVYSVREIERLVVRDELKIVFIDYLQLIRADGDGSLYETTSSTMRQLKELAKNQGITIFLLLQISRKGEGGWEPVSINMARDSGSIEEHSDFIIGVWNPSLKEGADVKLDGLICLKLLKNKRGSTKWLQCTFDTSSGRIREVIDRE